MTWKNDINEMTPVWVAIETYAKERIDELTDICISMESPDATVRAAQACIYELTRLVDLPKTIRAEARMKAGASSRKEY